MKFIIIIFSIISLAFACEYNDVWKEDYPYFCPRVTYFYSECFMVNDTLTMEVTKIGDTNSTVEVCPCPCEYEFSNRFGLYNFTVSLSKPAQLHIYGDNNRFGPIFLISFLGGMGLIVLVGCICGCFGLVADYFNRKGKGITILPKTPDSISMTFCSSEEVKTETPGCPSKV